VIKVLLVTQSLPVLEQDYRLLCTNDSERGKVNVYVNTRWLESYWKIKPDVDKETEKLLVAELESTENVEETLTNWFAEDAYAWLKTSEIQNFLQIYNLIDSPDIFSILETETTSDGAKLSRAILVNELDYLLGLNDT
jgi:hypothetical protein